jgi:prepilin-type N-terminal cleavage/methylation domain-containing protein
MNKILQFLLQINLKKSHKNHVINGFTLIELLVALILAVMIITPLMGFMLNILQTDQQEQAKTNTEQEVQSALDFIKSDLQQASYIYDADGIKAIQASLIGYSVTDNQVPVLVFWKRQHKSKGLEIKSKDASGNSILIKDDSFKISLVAYYIIKGNDPDKKWSKAIRIGRLQIEEGDPGFKLYDLTGSGTLKEKMNKWKSTPNEYKDKRTIVTLVDFIDQNVAQTNLSAEIKLALTPQDCEKTLAPKAQIVPAIDAVDNLQGIPGFYACVNSITPENKSEVIVYLRGNAIARLNNDENKIIYLPEKFSYFPQKSIRVQGHSFLFTR